MFLTISLHLLFLLIPCLSIFNDESSLTERQYEYIYDRDNSLMQFHNQKLFNNNCTATNR